MALDLVHKSDALAAALTSPKVKAFIAAQAKYKPSTSPTTLKAMNTASTAWAMPTPKW